MNYKQDEAFLEWIESEVEWIEPVEEDKAALLKCECLDVFLFHYKEDTLEANKELALEDLHGRAQPGFNSDPCDSCEDDAYEEGVEYSQDTTWDYHQMAWICDHCRAVL